jgi:hypothetical protein
LVDRQRHHRCGWSIVNAIIAAVGRSSTPSSLRLVDRQRHHRCGWSTVNGIINCGWSPDQPQLINEASIFRQLLNIFSLFFVTLYFRSKF